MNIEEWKPIPGHIGYEASSLGRVRSIDREIHCSDGSTRRRRSVVLRPALKKSGHLNVSLGGLNPGTFRVHRLVALAFHGLPIRDTLMVCHKDDIKTNNCPENLYWGTHKDNMEDSVRNNRPRNQYYYMTHCKRGHERTEDNSYSRPSNPGSRECLTCLRQRNKNYMRRKRACSKPDKVQD